jgi:cellulose biosynthesis protein BcsQ
LAPTAGCRCVRGTQAAATTLTELGKEGVKLVVIDTPPALNAAIGAIIKAASIVLVPVIPSPNDLMAIGETLDIVFRMGRPLIFRREQCRVRAADRTNRHCLEPAWHCFARHTPNSPGL